MKRIIGIICIICAVAMLLSACSSGLFSDETQGSSGAPEGTAAATDNGTAPEAPTTDAPPQIKDFGGETVFVLVREHSAYPHVGIFAEGITADSFDKQVDARNKQLEKQYNVVLKKKPMGNPHQELEWAEKSGEVRYDYALDCRNSLVKSALSGYLTDWKEIGVNTESNWWDSNIGGYDIAGKRYLAVNDVSISNFAYVRFLYFNRQVLEKFKLEDPYDMVLSGEWTLDKFLSMVKAACAPNEGPESVGIYGLLQDEQTTNGNIVAFSWAGDIPLTAWAEDGTLTAAGTEETAGKLRDIHKKLQTVLNAQCTLTYEQTQERCPAVSGDKYSTARWYFAQGTFLFMQQTASVQDSIRDMRSGYGIVPNPKYNAQQKEYLHSVDKFALIWVIPRSAAARGEDPGLLMDAWAYASRDTVMADYLNTLAKRGKERTADTLQNLQLIKRSVRYEIGFITNTDLEGLLLDRYRTVDELSWPDFAGEINNRLQKVNSQLAAQ